VSGDHTAAELTVIEHDAAERGLALRGALPAVGRGGRRVKDYTKV
jgi:hypothetical protein